MRFIRLVLGAILVVVLIMVGAVFFLPADRVARIAAEQLRVLTGRDVSITGDVALTFWPVLGASVGGLEVGNADWSEQGPMLTAENAAVGIDALALLRGEISITNIEAKAPTIRLEARADGRASWQFTDASGAASIETETAPTRPARAISIKRLSVSDATLIYDAEGSDLVSYTGVDLNLDWPERLGAAELSATLRPAGTPVEVVATIQGFAGFIAGQVQNLEAQISAGSGVVTLDGRASTAGDVAGRVTIAVPDTDSFLRALALPAPGLPAKLGKSVQMSADMTLTTDRNLSLRGLRADLGGNVLSGAADVALNGTPQVNAQLSAGALDLTNLGGTDNTGGGASVQTGWPSTPIDASGLAAFNGEIALSADSIALDSFNIGATRTLLRNDRSRMVFELREVQAYQGTVSGEFVMNNRSGLSVGGKIFAKGIAMQPLLRDAVELERLTGQGDAELQFLGVGQSVRAIMNSLSGKGALKMGQGTIEGIDLNRLMGNGQGAGGTTIFDSLGATFTMADGNLRNNDLLMLLPLFEARGAGRIGLGAQDLDYTFTPKALRVNSGKGLAIPVRILGPWSDPSIRPDLQAAIDLNFREERKALEERAKTQVEEKLKEELGVQTEDGQSVEDAVKDRVEDKLKREILKIFD